MLRGNRQWKVSCSEDIRMRNSSGELNIFFTLRLILKLYHSHYCLNVWCIFTVHLNNELKNAIPTGALLAQVGIILFNYLFTYLSLTRQRPDFQTMKNSVEDRNCTEKTEDLSEKNQTNDGRTVVLVPNSVEDDASSLELSESQIRSTNAKAKTQAPPVKSFGISWNRSILGK